MPRVSGMMHPTDNIPVPADKTMIILLAAGTPQASDWLSTGSSAMTNAATAGIGMVRATGMTTAGGAFLFNVNWHSTGAASSPSTGDYNGSTQCSALIASGPSAFQIPGGSTGFSVGAPTSGYVMLEMWKK